MKMTEKEFEVAMDASLKRFADEIVASGMSVFKIAKIAGLEWRTVKKAFDGIPIRFENAERIKLVIRTKNKS